MPNLILRSDRSLPGDVSAAAALHGDAVLDVQQIARWVNSWLDWYEAGS
ncbi:Uncharacterised protein [Mycobacteroides abscessus subsp. massiliense]|nr:Uncharacterised protein [Mycobacteroides abscessus subsp. massiliense]